MPVNLELIGQGVPALYNAHADLQNAPLENKIQVIADEIFNTLPKDDQTHENRVAINQIVENKLIDAHIATTLTPVLKKCRLDIVDPKLPSTTKIRYLSAQIIQNDPELKQYIMTDERATLVSNRVNAVLKDPSFKIDADLAVLAFADKIDKATEKSLHRDFPFLKQYKELRTLDEKKAFLIKKYSEYQSAFANHDLSQLPQTIKDFAKVTDWNSCNETFHLDSQPLSPQARTFIAFGHLVENINIYIRQEQDPAITYFIYREYPSIEKIPVERLALWETFASKAVEKTLESSCQQITTPSSSMDVEVAKMISLPKKEVPLFGENTPSVSWTQQFAADVERMGDTTLTIRSDGKETVLKEQPSPVAIYSELEPVMSGDQEGFYVLQEMVTQTVQNAGTEWLCNDIATKTGLSPGDASQFLTFIPNLIERVVDKVDKDTVRVTFKFNMSVMNPRLMNNIAEERIDLESLNLPEMPGTYQFIFSCEAKRDEEGEWIAQELKQHSEIPELSVPSEPIAEQSDDKVAGKEEEKPDTYELKEAPSTIPNTPPEGVKIRERERTPLPFNGNGKSSSDTKLDIGQLMEKYYKDPSLNVSAPSSSSQATQEPQNSQMAPKPSTTSSKASFNLGKIDQIAEQVEKKQHVSSRDKTYLTNFLCMRLKEIMSQEIFSETEKQEVLYGQKWINDRLKVLEDVVYLNSSEKDELKMIMEFKKLKNPAKFATDEPKDTLPIAQVNKAPSKKINVQNGISNLTEAPIPSSILKPAPNMESDDIKPKVKKGVQWGETAVRPIRPRAAIAENTHSQSSHHMIPLSSGLS